MEIAHSEAQKRCCLIPVAILLNQSGSLNQIQKSRFHRPRRTKGTADAEIWTPSDGSVTPLAAGADLTIPAMRALFVVE